MRYIKRCENCFREVRFPLDKGVLLVTCPYCKYVFKVNPDDILTYSEGRFDLTPAPSTTHLYSKFYYPFQKESIQKVIVILLFSLLFLNLFKSFGGFSNQTNHKQHQQEYTPPHPLESQDTENLEYI